MNALLLNPVLLRLGIVVFHALWELVLLGFLAWGALALGRRRSAQAQYLLAVAFSGRCSPRRFSPFSGWERVPELRRCSC